MTLGIGDHIAKLARKYDPDTQTTTHGPELTEGEAYHEFEVLSLTGYQGDPDGFDVKLKLVQ